MKVKPVAQVHCVDDGFGSMWDCRHNLPTGICCLEVVRPGKSQCVCEDNAIAPIISALLARPEELPPVSNAGSTETIYPHTNAEPFVDPGEEYDGWAEQEKAEELLREIAQMTDSVGIQRKIADYFKQAKHPAPTPQSQPE